MANIERNNICEEFYNQYSQLSDIKKDSFSRLCNKLLNENFIYKEKIEDKEDYYNVLGMKPIIENYFKLIDFDLMHVDSYKIFYIQTKTNRNRVRLKKLDTIILLILRFLYYKGSLNVHSSSDIQITIGEIVKEINVKGILSNPPSKTEYINSLKLLRRHKVIGFNFKDYEDDNILTIYPTILYVVKIDDIDMLNNKLDTYNSNIGGDENEIEENQID